MHVNIKESRNVDEDEVASAVVVIVGAVPSTEVGVLRNANKHRYVERSEGGC